MNAQTEAHTYMQAKFKDSSPMHLSERYKLLRKHLELYTTWGMQAKLRGEI